MSCYSPIVGYRAKEFNSNGKRPIVFNPLHSEGERVSLSCGRCIGCLEKRSREWAVRCHHEASLYSRNCFITLTYEDRYLPYGGSLQLKDFQDFMKRLRRRYGEGIRFFHCGEYGKKFGRPHYHACVFNFDFTDRREFFVRDGIRTDVSEQLKVLWPFGHSTVGDVTFESAAYVARYIFKKVFGSAGEDHYSVVDPSTGEWLEKAPEYTTMSRRPGIGTEWLRRYKTDVYPGDFVVINGKKMKPPKFYDGRFSFEHPEEFYLLKEKRILLAKKGSADNTRDRLMVKEQCHLARIGNLKRSLEDGE